MKLKISDRLIKTTLCAVMVAAFAATAPAQTPVYSWNFNGSGAGTGVPDVTGGGGTLNASGTGGFAGTGVSGSPNDYAYQASSTGGSAISSANITGLGSFTQLTVTMWINSSVLYSAQTFPTSVGRLFMIGGTTGYDEANTSTSNPQQGLSIALSGANGLQFGVGSSAGRQVNNVMTNFLANQWVFIAMEYDGTSGAYSSASMTSALGSAYVNNGALLLGTTSAGVGTVGGTNSFAFTLPDFVTSPGSINFSNNSIAFVGNNNGGARGFNGAIDNISVYNQLLTTSQLDAIRVGAVPEPATATLLGLGCLAGIAAFRRRRN